MLAAMLQIVHGALFDVYLAVTLSGITNALLDTSHILCKYTILHQ